MNKLTLLIFLSLTVLLYVGCKKNSHVFEIDDSPVNWNLNPGSFQHYMSIVAYTEFSKDTGNILAAFHGSELKGYSGGEIHEGRVVHFLLVYNNEAQTTIGFRLYQSEKGRVIGSRDSIIFSPGSGLGTPDNPYEIEF